MSSPALRRRHGRPQQHPSATLKRRRRDGRLLVECLLALVLLAGSTAALLTVGTGAMLVHDDAWQFDLAEQGAWRAAATALRAPCDRPVAGSFWQANARHTSDAQPTGPTSLAIADRWVRLASLVGTAGHDSARADISLQVACERLP